MESLDFRKGDKLVSGCGLSGCLIEAFCQFHDISFRGVTRYDAGVRKYGKNVGFNEAHLGVVV